ncbi:rhomboid family intramembrane serine protease [Alicyclobacillus acidiphilus]|uniref:rhomboid family intramembrane serine protease n=1 Tax=Alicyclobacillus acidiphilus TaxID=182455 RepID=UPI0009F8A50C|nr:rhomboid family intramembrane serine protease [Alicyclobacillus acidiphilus]
MNRYRSARIRSIRPWNRPVTSILIAANVLWFVIVENVTGYSASGLLRAGAMYAPLVYHGQWFRIISAMFVHVTIMHLLVNMISLWTLGVVEEILTASSMIVIYAVSGMVGNILGLFLASNIVSAGASGAIFGLFGAMLELAMLKVLPGVVRNQLLILLAVNVVLDISNLGSIDWLAHLGGLVCGALLTVLYVKRMRNPMVWKMGAIVATCLACLSLLLALFTPLP